MAGQFISPVRPQESTESIPLEADGSKQVECPVSCILSEILEMLCPFSFLLSQYIPYITQIYYSSFHVVFHYRYITLFAFCEQKGPDHLEHAVRREALSKVKDALYSGRPGAKGYGSFLKQGGGL